ncbi:MAG: hypothetical protein KKA73_04270 [Chloroflexi bacterium]|nr:hypothetical protein [Chloroflexota bacterium]MBU1746882.1 hypothetical protein [Chloroflexota bacterium]
MSRIYVALDLETTGLNPERDGIIEIGAVRFREDGQELEVWSTLVNPGGRIPHKIELLTGISQAELEAAPPLSAVSGRVGRFVGDVPVVGHNVSFDLGFLSAHGVPLANPSLDTFELASTLLPAMPSYNLGNLAAALDVDASIQHRALADARMTKDLLLALIARLDEMDLGILQEINRLAAQNPAARTWGPLALFRHVERRRVRTAFESPIAAQLRAQGIGSADSVGFFLVGQERGESLEPAETRTPLDVSALEALIAPDGPFARGFPGFEHRAEQVDMLQAVAQAFNDDAFLLVEAGTGTGKSLAYLLPAAVHALQNNEHVVISTNTINLQDQLYTKDIPDVRRVLSATEAGTEHLRAALVKGRSNYLCLRRWALYRQRDDLSLDEFRVLVKVLAWLPGTDTGDRSELTFGPGEWPAWDQLRADAEACDPARCPHFHDNTCFFYRARHRAESAHLIVVNHALLLSDASTGNRVLPEFRYLVIDEAHHLEDRATEHLGFVVEQRGLERFLDSVAGRPADRAGGLVAEIGARVQRARLSAPAQQALDEVLTSLHRRVQELRPRVHAFFVTLSSFLSQYDEGQSTYDTRVRVSKESPLRFQPDWDRVEIDADNLRLALGSLRRSLQGIESILTELDEEHVSDHDTLLGEVVNARTLAGGYHDQLNQVIFEPSPDMIYWCTVSKQKESLSLHAAPLHVGELLQKYLFDKKRAAVLTSATLSTAGSFDYVRDRLGLDGVRETQVGSPFDYQSATLLYVPTDIPEPGQPYYQKSIESAVVALCQATEGRALVLFTSYSQLRATYKAIVAPLEAAGIAVLGQGLDGSRRHLLETFKSDQRTVLLGTSSFWEGIDVVGEALSVLVITRLPFTVPSDPVFAARSEAFEYDAFGLYAVPQAVLRFKQGFGRLIRSRTDRGVVAVLDRRLLTKRYGEAFLNSLPDCTRRKGPVSRLPGAAVRWLEQDTEAKG